jgi:RNA polymerase subunit RPABC4/transcription elongation factor Spt4
VLGSACETCGAGEEAILYVQHTVRLPSISAHKELAKSKLAGREFEPVDYEGLREQMYAIRDAEEPELRDCCPACGSLSIQYRKKAATWICNSKATGQYCAHVFEVPAKKPALTVDQKKTIRREKRQAWRDIILNREDDWMRDAMLGWIDEMRVYLSLKHTKTLCKRCAFLEDMTEDKPCRACGYVYPKTEQSCPDCGEQDAHVMAQPT